MNVLFLCTGNSARSILAEALTNHLAGGRVSAYSAGSFPKPHPHPLALDVLRSHAIQTSGLRSKSWNDFTVPAAPVIDVVITVCDAAAAEVCPIWPGKPLKVHWGIPDPAAAGGSDDEQRAAFLGAFDILQRRVTAFLRLPLEELMRDEVHNHLTRIAEDEP
jgi:protein-tyrosine-phosphatase